MAVGAGVYDKGSFLEEFVSLSKQKGLVSGMFQVLGTKDRKHRVLEGRSREGSWQRSDGNSLLTGFLKLSPRVISWDGSLYPLGVELGSSNQVPKFQKYDSSPSWPCADLCIWR